MNNKEAIEKVRSYLRVININDSTRLLKRILNENEEKIINKKYFQKTKDFLSQIDNQLSDISYEYNRARDEDQTDRSYNNLMIDLLTVTDQLETLLEIENIISIALISSEGKEGSIEIKLNADYDSFTNQDVNKILSHISELIGIDFEQISVNGIRKGSVILSLELPSAAEAEKLFMLIKLGKLGDKGITNANLRSLVDSRIEDKKSELEVNIFKKVKDQIKNGNTKLALDYLDSYLEQKYPKYHNYLILHKASYSKIIKNVSIGLITSEEANTKESRIILAILTMIDELISND